MVKEHHCQKNKTLPGSHCISIVSNATCLIMPRELQPLQATHSHSYVPSRPCAGLLLPCGTVFLPNLAPGSTCLPRNP